MKKCENRFSNDKISLFPNSKYKCYQKHKLY